MMRNQKVLLWTSETLISFKVVKIRLQQQRGLSPELREYKGPVHCARMIIREEGLLGPWAGAAPTEMHNGTNKAAMFTAKNAFDVVLWNKHVGDGKILLPWESMISGFLAGTAGPICTGSFGGLYMCFMPSGPYIWRKGFLACGKACCLGSSPG